VSEEPAGRARVLDVRYSRYAGARPSGLTAVRTLTRWSLLRVLGARRSWTAKIWPLGLIGLAFAPGLAVLGVRAMFANEFGSDELPVDLLPYADYLGVINLLVLVITATITPALLCPDRRDRVLSLYVSTAVSGVQYLAAKAAAAVILLLVVTVLPVFTLFLGNLMFADDFTSYVVDNADVLWRIVVAGALVAVYHAAIGLAIASMTKRRAFAVGGYLALMLTTPILAAVLIASQDEDEQSSFILFELPSLPFLLASRVFGKHEQPPTWQLAAGCVAVVVFCAALLVLRYRREDG
jgi:ABC-2 type transport system permease protein